VRSLVTGVVVKRVFVTFVVTAAAKAKKELKRQGKLLTCGGCGNWCFSC
jgi:hypothetical protein